MLLKACDGLWLLLLCGACVTPGVQSGAERVSRSVFCAEAHVGTIRFITLLDPAPADGGSLWVGGEYGAARFAPDGSLRSRVGFGERVLNPAPVDMRHDGTFRTMSRGGGWSPVCLVDERGRQLWRFPTPGSDEAADAMAAGPIGPEGRTGFVVGMNAAGGLFLLDGDGHETWHIEAHNVTAVEIADLDGDGRVEIIHTDNRQDALQVRDPQASAVRAFPVAFSHFSLVRWPQPDSPPRVLGIDDGLFTDTLQVLDASDGRVIASYELPDHGFAQPFGAAVRPAPGAPFDFAIGRTLRATASRSALYVFDAQRRLLYHELLPVPHFGFTAMPAGTDGTQDLLVGVGHALWRYSIAP